MTLLEALALAGSPTTSASNEIIVIHPRKPNTPGAPFADGQDGEEIRVNLKDLQLGRAGRDVLLRDGDIINVPKASTFYIMGQVKNGGTFVLEPGMTVLQAISLAGGLSDRGSDRRIRVRRLVNGKETEVDVRQDDKVLANDVIVVNARIF
jgi:polysaccharide export outer membrane protein